MRVAKVQIYNEEPPMYLTENRIYERPTGLQAQLQLL